MSEKKEGIVVEDTIKRKRGRPKKEVTRPIRFEFRLSEEEWGMLTFLAYESDLPRAEALRKIIKVQYNLKKYAY